MSNDLKWTAVSLIDMENEIYEYQYVRDGEVLDFATKVNGVLRDPSLRNINRTLKQIGNQPKAKPKKEFMKRGRPKGSTNKVKKDDIVLKNVKKVLKEMPKQIKGLGELRERYKDQFGEELKLKGTIKDKVLLKKYGNTFLNLVRS